MKKDWEAYKPGELSLCIEPDEDMRYSFFLAQCKRDWLGFYSQQLGVHYHCHFTTHRLILEAKVLSANGFFLLKVLSTAVMFGLGAGGLKVPRASKRYMGSELSAGKKSADDVRDQFLSIPYDAIDRFERAWPCYTRIVLDRPPRGFDPYSLVFAVGPLPERRVWRNGYTVRTDFITIGNRMLDEAD